MNQTSLSFTVFFEDPFWIGLFEYREQQLLYLKRIVFGSEPSEQVVYEWLKGCWYSISFQAPVETVRSKASHRNPKRMQREAWGRLIPTVWKCFQPLSWRRKNRGLR